jgi:predicted enzyme related to lactoylglutathione lyase
MLQTAPMYAYIPAKDMDRARKFYEDTLGFKAKEVTPDGVVYECSGKTAAYLYKTPNAGTSKASQAFWQVADIDREMKDLKDRGVRFERYDNMPGQDANGVMNAGGAKAAWFKDPEGNIMALIQNVSG